MKDIAFLCSCANSTPGKTLVHKLKAEIHLAVRLQNSLSSVSMGVMHQLRKVACETTTFGWVCPALPEALFGSLGGITR